MSNKGFTLLEMLIVLSVAAISVCIIPIFHPADATILNIDVTNIQNQLLRAQQNAMRHKQTSNLVFYGNTYQIDDHMFSLSKKVSCKSNPFHFNEVGNVSTAFTIHCSCGNAKKELVIELGSGRIYVR